MNQPPKDQPLKVHRAEVKDGKLRLDLEMSDELFYSPAMQEILAQIQSLKDSKISIEKHSQTTKTRKHGKA